MPRRMIKRYLPDHAKVRHHKHLQFLGDRLHDPNLWHLNRRSVAGAMGMGVFVAFIPVPMQMVIAAIAAVWLRVNLPLAVAMVWITNPFTIPPILFFTYKVGAWLLNYPPAHFQLELSLEWLLSGTSYVWRPLLAGSLLVGTALGIIVYIAVRLAWRLHIVRKRFRKLPPGPP